MAELECPDWAPEGFHKEGRPAAKWRLAEPAEQQRYTCRGTRPSCPNPPVAALLREWHRWTTHTDGARWWFYCAEHMYGRWIEGHTVMEFFLVEDQP